MKSSTQRSRRALGGLSTALVCAVAACGDSSPSTVENAGATDQALGGYDYTDHRAWSQSPPGGLTASQVPMFVQIGFDDNQRSGLNTSPPSGMTWVTEFFRGLRNPAGSGNAATFDNAPARVSFYSNTTYISSGSVEDPVLLKRSWKTALDDGHELGSHTHTHPDGGGFTTAQWDSEIATNVDWLTRAFVPNEPAFSVGSGPGASVASIEGFRSPFLSYNPNLFTVLKQKGFTYDISVEDGWQLSDDGTNFSWPYTLDDGSPGGTAVGRPTGNQPGLWELGAAPFVIPPALRAQLGLTKITGLDYNLFLSVHLTKAQALAVLEYTLDQRLASNRAPMFIGAHTNIYTDAVTDTGTTPQERREVIQEFVNYALSKPQVRFVTGKALIPWLRNPVALGASCTAESNAAFCARLGKTCGTVTANDNCGASRTVTSCGACTSPETCGGGGASNVCGSPSNDDKTEGGSATGTGSPCNATTEAVVKAYDNLMTSGSFSKWCITSAPSTSVPVSTVYDFAGTTAHAITQYTITTGNDQAPRDPKSWTFQGCQGTCTAGSDAGWTTLDTRTNQLAGAARFQTSTYSFSNAIAYQQYRLRITANIGDTARTQIAELQMFAGACTPEADGAFCSRLGKSCGTVTANDNCGASRTVASCGTCTSPMTCGGGGTANVCGGTSCTPETNGAFCARLGKTCGAVTANDNCGASRTVSSCGTCTSPATCGGGGTANVCGGGGTTTCATAYAQGNCLTYATGTVVSNGGHNWTCSNGNCANCAGYAACAPGGSGCPWGVVWNDSGVCQ
jgi:peptidoglycan/xylan/chitin deacetylase (PgdA/CDA1 family)